MGWWLLSIVVRVLAPTPCRLEPTSPSEPGAILVERRHAMVTIIRVTDDTTRIDLAETLAILNVEAKALRRKGYTGTASMAYSLQHDRINAVLDAWQDAHG